MHSILDHFRRARRNRIQALHLLDHVVEAQPLIGIEIEDEEDTRNVSVPNGAVDELTLSGPP